MYKVFFNRKFVLLTTQIVDHNDETPFFYIKYSDQKQIISALKSKKTKGVYLYHPKEDKLWKHMLKTLFIGRSSRRSCGTSKW